MSQRRLESRFVQDSEASRQLGRQIHDVPLHLSECEQTLAVGVHSNQPTKVYPPKRLQSHFLAQGGYMRPDASNLAQFLLLLRMD